MSDPNGAHPLEQLTAYLDDELSIEDRATVDRHLAECASCRAHLEGIRLLATAIAEEHVPEPPDDLVVRVAQRIDESAVVPFHRTRFKIPATIAATIAAIGLVGVVAWRQGAIPRGAPAPVSQRDEHTTPAGDTERLKDAKAQEPASRPAVNGSGKVTPPEGNESSVQGAREREFAKSSEENKPSAPEATGDARPKLDQLGYVRPAPRESDQGVAGGVVGGISGGVEGGTPANAERQDAGVAAKGVLAKSKKKAEQEAARAISPPLPPSPAAAREMQAPAAQRSAAPEAPANALPQDVLQADKALRAQPFVSACAERWVDAGVIATWEVADRERAQSEIAALATKHGGFVQPADPSAPGLVGVVVPAKRFPAFATEARSRGMAGFADGAGDASGACIRQRIGLLPSAPR